MSNNVKLRLRERHIALLQALPEQGMGYHLVNVKLKNGNVLKSKFIFNSMYLQLDECEVVSTDDIDTIELVTQ
jgi:hypothetical protein